ncbi:unnamed protein product [Heligmosomoides polygyrus]|uniref:Transmembrane protein n=1 Tax=Heligmosomoides polygyrus TaxID=6339 RepID=A0A3P7XFJ7_HELPZ|nr:unnamed protein product [Heligmosomoides polygyrus]
MLAGDVVRRVGTAISDAFWVVFYFFYYLVACLWLTPHPRLHWNQADFRVTFHTLPINTVGALGQKFPAEEAVELVESHLDARKKPQPFAEYTQCNGDVVTSAARRFHRPRPEWKCDRCTASVQKNCCVEVRKNEQSGEKRESQKSTTTPSSPTKWSSGAPRGFQKKSYWASFKEWCRNAANTVGLYARRVGRFCYSVLCKVARVLRTILQYLWAILKALFWSDIESKSLPPSAPKPFQIKPPEDSPTFNKVEFNPNEIVESLEKEKARLVMSSYSNEPVLAPAPAPDSGPAPAPAPRQFVPAGAPETSYDAGPSTYPRKFTDTSLDTSYNVEETTTVPPQARAAQQHPPPPPPAPPPPPFKPLRIDTVYGREDAAMERWDRESNDLHAGNEVTAKREPPGIGKLPADVMAELHGTQKMRQERERETSVQREMTQSCHPDMAQWNAESRYDRSATATPYRASSVGPTMRKLEQVVSRLEDSSDNEARAKPSDYMMGKSVFTPLEEAERMRDTINRPVTPAHSVVSGRMTPYAQDTSYGTHSYRGAALDVGDDDIDDNLVIETTASRGEARARNVSTTMVVNDAATDLHV